MALVVCVVFLLDQVTKLMAVGQLEGQPPTRLLGGLVYLSFTRNPGAAFGLGSGFTIIFPFVYLLVIGIIVYFAPRIRSIGWAVALSLVMAGALGNLMDRLFRSPGPFRGAVVDFISVFAPYGEKFAIFNVADSAISVGGVLALLLALLGHEMDGTRHRGGPGERGRSRGMSPSRLLPVPDGLDGMRVDAGLARLLGVSRTTAAEWAESGAVLQDGREVGKSDRLAAAAVLDVTMPEPRVAAPLDTTAVPGLRVVYADEDIVVVDKPVGVAAHPSPGWTGPTVVGGLAAAGYRVSTSGAAERQGIVHRLDVGTTGLMVVAVSERAYTVLKAAFKERTVEKIYHAIVQGHPDPSTGTIDAPIDRHPRHDYKFAVVAGGKDSVTHYEVIEAFPAASLSRSTWRRGGPTRSGCTSARCATPASVT